MTDEAKLEFIFQYKMNKEEAKAWKIAILFINLVNKYFPDYKHQLRIPKKDPRKSELFKHCYKLMKSTDLQDQEFRIYISAQLQILKAIELKDGIHPLILPSIITGPKAWNRWLLWKRKYDKVEYKTEIFTEDTKKIILALKETKSFLMSKFELNKQNIEKSLENRTLYRWCALGLISPYFLALSPTINKDSLLEKFTIDVALYEKNITPEVRQAFKDEFSFEYE